MNKGAVLFGLLTAIGGVGYYLYDQGYIFKAKPKPAYVPIADRTGSDAVENQTKKVKRRKVPELNALSLEQARDAVKRAGFDADKLTVMPNKGCSYNDEHDMVPADTVCGQEPTADAEVNDNVAIGVIIEHDTWEHGAAGMSNEWRRMPDLTGMTLTEAQALLADKGFAPDEFSVEHSGGNDCEPGKVCATTPDANQRKVKARPGILQLGATN